MANPGCQLSGGMTLQMPYLLPSGAIFLMYSIGSLNSSSVGRKVGASCRPCGLTRLFVSRTASGWPRLSTVDMSSGGALRALKGMWGGYAGYKPLLVMRGPDCGGAAVPGVEVDFESTAGIALVVVPPEDGGTTISKPSQMKPADASYRSGSQEVHVHRRRYSSQG